MNKEKTCCFSGHRKLSGDLGFDTMAASMVITLKELGHPNIKIVFALPCKDQDRLWKQREKDLYKELLQEADEVIYVSEKYHQGCMHERNRWMIDNSSHCICYLTQGAGGTAYTVAYAKGKEKMIINIASNE